MDKRTKNLKPFNEYKPDELREIAIKGGKASGEARAERRKLKDELNAILADGDSLTRICTALIVKAKDGDPRAFEIIRDTLGEKAADLIKVESEDGIEKIKSQYRAEIIQLTADEMRRSIDTGAEKYRGLAEALCDIDMKREAVGIALDKDSDKLTVEP